VWSNPKRDNAICHAKRKHRELLNSSDNTVLERSSDMGLPLKQAKLDNYHTATPSESALRKVFNPQRYTESMVGLLTHRRLPFSAVTWDEMQDVMLSCNPAIEDLIMASRHEAMRHITANFSLYQSQLKAKLQSAVSKVHISSDLWTSPHRHGVLAINWDPKRHRIRCILHVINLSLQAFLFASSREALQAALDAASDITGDEHYEPFNFILNDASGGDTTNQPDHMEAQTEHPGGVACKRTPIQKELYEAEETHDPLMLHSIDMGWFVLDKYYALSGESPIYATALLLDPSKRARYLEINWKGEWAEAAIRDALSIWEEEYKMAPTLGPAQALSEAFRSQQGHSNKLDRLLNEIMVAEDITRDVDDFENFIHNKPIKIEGSPLVWWCQRDQVRTYPRLSRMAIDTLSVPPGSADPESAFSGGRRTLSWGRERMSCVNLEKVECIGNWLREGLIIPSSRGGRGLVVDGEINGSVHVDSDDNLD
ncbi:hypothetical protein FOXYS1_14492, partial [Fusarium oxysporum]